MICYIDIPTYIIRSDDFFSTLFFNAISDLSDLYASPYFGPLAVITLFVFVDIFLMVFFVGETNKKSYPRVGRPPVRHHHAARGQHYHGHHGGHGGHYGGVGRMGDAEGEEIDELQRLESLVFYTKIT